MSDLEISPADHPETQEIVDVIQMLRGSVEHYVVNAPDPRQAMLNVMVACCTLAGEEFGGLLFQGWVNQQHRSRAAETALKNFRAGVEIGHRRAQRVAQMGEAKGPRLQ